MNELESVRGGTSSSGLATSSNVLKNPGSSKTLGNTPDENNSPAYIHMLDELTIWNFKQGLHFLMQLLFKRQAVEDNLARNYDRRQNLKLAAANSLMSKKKK